MHGPHITRPNPRQARNGNRATCAGCGVPLRPKPGSRRQKFCSYHCRDEARRARNFAISGSARRGSQGIPRSVENNGDKSKACKADFGDRAPLELLGHGHRWPGARYVDIGALIRRVIEREIGGAGVR
jgi:hypothetical protein